MNPHPHSKELKEPIIILGNPRSGTTMFRLMLTSHKHIVIPPECGFAAWLYPKYKHWNQSTDRSLLQEFIQDVLKSRKFETWEINPDHMADFLFDRHPGSYSHAVSAVYEYYAVSRDRTYTRWGDKNNFYIQYIPTLIKMFPKAYFIHLVRDGRNVACSYLRLNQRHIDSEYVPRLPSNIEEIALEWKNNVNLIYSKLSGRKQIRFYEIRFEDLVQNAESHLSKLCHWFGEDYDPSMSKYYQNNKNKTLEPKAFLQWKAKTLKPPIVEEINRYQHELTTADRQCFESIARDELNRYHYPMT